ncbi:MAG: DnaJ domain-containing protein [Burkholderiaceae bacterium]|nr:DnaJ domain-containing protein [Burkholderiaceae bacterium]
MKTLYDLLEVEAGATQAQIEQGYKRQLDRYLQRPHAGKTDQETRRMQHIREAYLLLCSPQKRQVYDQQLQIFLQARKRVFNRANLWRAALAALGVLAVASSLYLFRSAQGLTWNGPAAGSDQALLSQGPQGTGQSRE